jgi:hypothetical protein
MAIGANANPMAHKANSSSCQFSRTDFMTELLSFSRNSARRAFMPCRRVLPFP